MQNTNAILKSIQQNNEDYEWYPTTTEMVEVIKSDFIERTNHQFTSYCEKEKGDVLCCSVLDCGAGDGRVLKQITKSGKKYAIEKSKILIDAMPNDIFIVGTDFTQQTLIDKQVSLIFSNPPYSQYAEWAIKIINEAYAPHVYLIIPKRWRQNTDIEDALKKRKADVHVIANFDFLNADRKARAEVEILYIDMSSRGWSSKTPRIDPFRMWFNDFFKAPLKSSTDSEWDIKSKTARNTKQKVENALVAGGDLIKVLEKLYQEELDNLIFTYQKLSEIDESLLDELNVDFDSVFESLKLKITSLKDVYWKELFNNLDKITNKLCSSSRSAMLKTLCENTHVDFTATNAYAIVTWACKNANSYFDSQLIELVEFMTEKANILNYKSNQRTFRDENWRYNQKPFDLSHYALDYRIVVERSGGLCTASWTHEQTKSGLSSRCSDFLNDIRTVAANLGYSLEDYSEADSFDWKEDKSKKLFKAIDMRTNKEMVLFEARAFKNGNAHLKIDQAFIMKLNCEFGRLKGWLKSPKDASDEIGVPLDIAEQSFGSNFQISNVSYLALGCDSIQH